MYKKEDEAYLKSLGIQNWGDNRTPPTPYQKCDISELGSFWSMFMSYGADKIEYRQVTTEDGEFRYTNVHIIKYHDRAFMLKIERIKEGNKFKDIPVCYRLGCIHDYDSEILNSRSGDCRNTCKKCGYSYEYNCGD